MLLQSALYTKLDSLPRNGVQAPEALEQWLAVQIAGHLARFREHGLAPVKHHFVTSTVLTNTFKRNCMSWPRLRTAIQQQSGSIPGAFLNAYECAGWGYILRLMRQLGQAGDSCLISILDVNAYDFEFWNANPHWGHSGFGLCTLQIQLTDDASALHVSQATSMNAFTNFAMEIRKKLMSETSLCAAMPFFPQATQTLFDRTLSSVSRLQDRHAGWGHCFGSDPWLSIILSSEEQYDFSRHSAMLACSLALSGYFSLARIGIDPKGLFLRVPEIPEQIILRTTQERML